MTKLKTILLIYSICALIVYVVFVVLSATYNPTAEIKRYNVGDSKTLKVGIMGDTQLICSDTDTNYNYTDHLVKSLQIMKEQQVQAIVFTGDLSNNGRAYAYNIFVNLFNEIFPDKETAPILNFVMGNHEYWYYIYFPTVAVQTQRAWEKALNEKPFSHKVINGFHFINWSSMDPTNINCNPNVNWAREQIELAINEDPKKPVFVTTHFPPRDTMYLSDEVGVKLTRILFDQYEQVISFSGHTHAALTDERSIWQDTFTAIQTQAVAYIGLEQYKENGHIPKDEFNDIDYSKRNYMGIIMTLNDTAVEMKRISFENNTFYKEEEPWVIDIPVKKETFRYTHEKRMVNRRKQYFEEGGNIEFLQQEKDGKIISN